MLPRGCRCLLTAENNESSHLWTDNQQGQCQMPHATHWLLINSTGKNESERRSVASDSLQPHGLYVARQAPLSVGFPRQECWSG